MWTFCRTKFGLFPEYHTSKDDFNLVTSKGLIGSYKIMMNIINSLEIGLFPKIKVLGEPQLGKRDLYPSISKLYEGKHPAEVRMNVIAYCDAEHSLFDIAVKINENIEKVNEEVKILIQKDLISAKFL